MTDWRRRLFAEDVLTACVLLMLSIAAFARMGALPARAAMFPRLVAGLLFALSALYLGRELLLPQEAQRAAFFHHFGRFVAALVLIIGYALTFPRSGFFTATFVFILIFAAAMGMRRWLLTLAAAATFTAGAWVIFVVLLNRQLPPELVLDLLLPVG